MTTKTASTDDSFLEIPDNVPLQTTEIFFGGTAPALTPAERIAAEIAVVRAGNAAQQVEAAVPSWVNQLVDPTIKTLMTQAFSNGTVTEASMGQMFARLAWSMMLTHSTLSATQFTDLTTIALKLSANPSEASAYVAAITSAIVPSTSLNFAASHYAEQANSTASFETNAPGELAIGATGSQLAELVLRWFGGDDSPIATVSAGTSSEVKLTYAESDAPLYASAAGPSASDVNQGSASDCFLLATLAEVATKNPSLIESMITDNGNGTYGVRFYNENPSLGAMGAPIYVTVSADFAQYNGRAAFNESTGGMWASLIEKAYAQLGAMNPYFTNDSYDSLEYGGDPVTALAEVTGTTAQVVSWPSSDTTLAAKVSDLTKSLDTLLANGHDVLASSPQNETNTSGQYTLLQGHCFSVVGVDAANGDMILRNPWGTNSANGTNYVPTFEMSVQTLIQDGVTFYADNLQTVTGATAAQAAADQANANVSAFSVIDTAQDIAQQITSLAADSKLSALQVSGATGSGFELNLSSIDVTTSINMGSDFAHASAGLGSASFTFVNNANEVTLGSGGSMITGSLLPSNGLLVVSGFQFGRDSMTLTAPSLPDIVDTTLNGQAAVAIYEASSPTTGVVMIGLGAGTNAAMFLADMHASSGSVTFS